MENCNKNYNKKYIYQLFDIVFGEEWSLIFQTEDVQEMLEFISDNDDIHKNIEVDYREVFRNVDNFTREINSKNPNYEISGISFSYTELLFAIQEGLGCYKKGYDLFDYEFEKWIDEKKDEFFAEWYEEILCLYYGESSRRGIYKVKVLEGEE